MSDPVRIEYDRDIAVVTADKLWAIGLSLVFLIIFTKNVIAFVKFKEHSETSISKNETQMKH